MNRFISEFSEFEYLFENIKAAEKFLMTRALNAKKEIIGETDKRIGLLPEEQKQAISDPNYLRIKSMTENPDYIYGFLRFFYEGMLGLDTESRFERLSNILTSLELINRVSKNRKDLGLPKNFSEYASEKSKGLIELENDLKACNIKIKANNWIKDLPKDQREMFKEADLRILKIVCNISDKFMTLGFGNAEIRDSIIKTFYRGVVKYSSIEEILKAANDTIKSSKNNSLLLKIRSAQTITDELGENLGVKMVYCQDEILIVIVRSWEANRRLNGDVGHCIVRTEASWNEYMRGGNVQYYLYDFSRKATDPLSVIGITLTSSGTISACHTKFDAKFLSQISNHLESLGVPLETLKIKTEEYDVSKITSKFDESCLRLFRNLTNVQKDQLRNSNLDAKMDGIDPNILKYLTIKSKYFTSFQELLSCTLDFFRFLSYTNIGIFEMKLDSISFKTGRGELLFNKSNVIVLKINDHSLNRELNSCSSWRSSISETNFIEERSRFFIYNFNLRPENPLSMISITSSKDGRKGLGSRLKDDKIKDKDETKALLNQMNIPLNIFDRYEVEDEIVPPIETKPEKPKSFLDRLIGRILPSEKSQKEYLENIPTGSKLTRDIVSELVSYRDVNPNQFEMNFEPDSKIPISEIGIKKMTKHELFSDKSDGRDIFSYGFSVDNSKNIFFLLFRRNVLKMVLNLRRNGFCYMVFNNLFIFYLANEKRWFAIDATNFNTMKWSVNKVSWDVYKIESSSSTNTFTRGTNFSVEETSEYKYRTFKEFYRLPETIPSGQIKFLKSITDSIEVNCRNYGHRFSFEGIDTDEEFVRKSQDYPERMVQPCGTCKKCRELGL